MAHPAERERYLIKKASQVENILYNNSLTQVMYTFNILILLFVKQGTIRVQISRFIYFLVTRGPSKTGKSPKRWMVYTNKNHVQYIHHTTALSFICDVMKARGWNST
jgi:hypothetical protein